MLREVCEFVDEALDREHIELDFDPPPRAARDTTLDWDIGDADVLCWVGMVNSAAEFEGFSSLRVTLADDCRVRDPVRP